MRPELKFISFQPSGGAFVPVILLEDAMSSEEDLDGLAHRAAEVYFQCIDRVRRVVMDIRQSHGAGRPVSARQVWRLGDSVFVLKESLEQLGFQLDDLYLHVERDAGVSRNLLRRAVSFRRYVDEEQQIPETLTWSRCEQAPRREAIRLKSGLGHEGT